MSLPGATPLNQYRYDPLDRLIANALPNEPEHQRFYCKSRLATEIQGVMRYTIMRDDDQLLAQLQDDGTASKTTILITNQQHSVLDTLGAKKQRQPITYAPYGFRPAASRLLSLLGFNGECPDPVTGCYLLGSGYRAFNVLLMRFNSPDSLSPFGQGGINAYAYCSADPINNYDPSGHLKLPSFMRPRRFKSSNTVTRQTVTSETRTFTETTKKTTPDNSWIAKTHRTDEYGKKIFEESQWGNSERILTETPYRGLSVKKTNPSLYETALKNIEESEYQKLINSSTLPTPDKIFTKHNIFKRSEELRIRSFDSEGSVHNAFIEAMQKKIRGANPEYAKTLYGEWKSNPRFSFFN